MRAIGAFHYIISRLGRMGCRALLRPEPAAAFGGRWIVFSILASLDLVELTQPRAIDRRLARGWCQ